MIRLKELSNCLVMWDEADPENTVLQYKPPADRVQRYYNEQ